MCHTYTLALCMATTLFFHYSFLFFSWFITISLIHFIIKTCVKKNHQPPVSATARPPPSPPALPFIGHLHLMLSVLPKTFQALALRYGPLMQLKIGSATCYIVSNAATAKELFKTQELNFSSRPGFGSSEYFLYKGSSFITAQYGEYWRFMKKICMTKLLSVPQLEKLIHIREEEIMKLLKLCKERGEKEEEEEVDLSLELTRLTNNMICRMAMSTCCAREGDEAKEVKELVDKMMNLAGKLVIGDGFGPMKVLNLFGNNKMYVLTLQRFDQLLERIMKEHEDDEKKAGNGCDDGGESRGKDLMHILLEIQKDSSAEVKLSRTDIKSFLLDIFMAATHTTSVCMQWAMAELINNPKVFKKLRDEIESVVGQNRLVRESDVPNLPYLRAVVKEVLRLHTSAPFVMRECSDDCRINGFDLKGKSRVLVNAFAIMRDPKVWEDPTEFVPERFLNNLDEKIDDHEMKIKSSNFHYLPFGSGRRGCPGASLAQMVMHSTIGALVQCFDWKVKGGEKVDLEIRSGFSADMAHPLVCYPITQVFHFEFVYK